MSDASMDDRRRGERHDQGNLALTLHRKALFGLMERHSVATWLDFNRFGVGMQTAEAVRVGEALLLDLALDDGEEHLELKGAPVMVRRVSPDAGGFRLGVEFDFDSELIRSPDTQRCLEAIERHLEALLRAARHH